MDFRQTTHQMSRIHIIGAGLAGLSAAIHATGLGRQVTLYESTGAAGGRCRSYHDSELDIVLDNGNHLLLSGNKSAFAYIAAIGAADRLTGPRKAIFPFLDVRTGKPWTLRINRGRIPWWLLFPERRVPNTDIGEYFMLRSLGKEMDDTVVAETLRHGSLYWHLIEPLSIAALNTRPHEGLACLLGAVLRESLLKGGRACVPRMAKDGLSDALIDPAIETLRKRGAEVLFDHRATELTIGDGRVSALVFGERTVTLDQDDRVILAAPPWIAADLVPGLTVPDGFESILNIHFKLTAKIAEQVTEAGFIGIISGHAQWIFVKKDHVSVTISAANAIVDRPAEEIARAVWPNVIDGLDLEGPAAAEMPPYKVIKEKRATFTANVTQEERRPPAQTHLTNLILAGDWTDTRLPATIEGAIRSGVTAVNVIVKPPRPKKARRRTQRSNRELTRAGVR